MEKRVALYGFLAVLAVCWNTSLCNAEPRKITEAEKNFCAEACHKYCGEYGLDAAELHGPQRTSPSTRVRRSTHRRG
jgi:hypothetical protein